MKFFKNKKINILIILFIIIAILWGTRILPSRISIFTARRYVDSKYPERDFKYTFIEYSKAHGEYFVHFTDKDGERVAFMVSPFSIGFDPLNLPN